MSVHTAQFKSTAFRIYLHCWGPFTWITKCVKKFYFVDISISDCRVIFVSFIRFKISNNGHVIEVNLYDEIDFVCPYFSMMSNSSSSYEYYIIYQVCCWQKSIFYSETMLLGV